jgi:hypothetical protein
MMRTFTIGSDVNQLYSISVCVDEVLFVPILGRMVEGAGFKSNGTECRPNCRPDFLYRTLCMFRGIA